MVGNVDNLIRPYVFRRWARIHPFITVIGAFAGISWFGLVGLLIGPLAISYFFELIRMYRDEYLRGEEERARARDESRPEQPSSMPVIGDANARGQTREDLPAWRCGTRPVS